MPFHVPAVAKEVVYFQRRLLLGIHFSLSDQCQMEMDSLVPPQALRRLEQGLTSLETIPCAGSPQPHHRAPETRGVQLQGPFSVATDGEKRSQAACCPLPPPFT